MYPHRAQVMFHLVSWVNVYGLTITVKSWITDSKVHGLTVAGVTLIIIWQYKVTRTVRLVRCNNDNVKTNYDTGTLSCRYLILFPFRKATLKSHLKPYFMVLWYHQIHLDRIAVSEIMKVYRIISWQLVSTSTFEGNNCKHWVSQNLSYLQYRDKASHAKFRRTSSTDQPQY